jgi:hypothetical protein
MPAQQQRLQGRRRGTSKAQAGQCHVAGASSRQLILVHLCVLHTIICDRQAKTADQGQEWAWHKFPQAGALTGAKGQGRCVGMAHASCRPIRCRCSKKRSHWSTLPANTSGIGVAATLSGTGWGHCGQNKSAVRGRGSPSPLAVRQQSD